jgi:hypothetical protein
MYFFSCTNRYLGNVLILKEKAGVADNVTHQPMPQKPTYQEHFRCTNRHVGSISRRLPRGRGGGEKFDNQTASDVSLLAGGCRGFMMTLLKHITSKKNTHTSGNRE